MDGSRDTYWHLLPGDAERIDALAATGLGARAILNRFGRPIDLELIRGRMQLEDGDEHRPWSDAELRILSEVYPTHGLRGVHGRLPKRSFDSNQGVAGKLDLRRLGRRAPARLPEDLDAILTAQWPDPGSTAFARNLAARLGCAPQTLWSRAKLLGLTGRRSGPRPRRQKPHQEITDV